MKTSYIVAIAVAGMIAVAGLILVVSGISTYNTQSSLKNTYEMKVEANKTDFDNMFKKIQQTAQVSEAQKDAFKEIYTSYASARTSEGQGKVMAWIREAAPKVDLKIYTQVLNIVVGSRDSWTSRQKELVDVAREYNQNLVTFPKNIFLGFFGFKKIEPQIVTSTRTENAFKTGRDDDIDLKIKK
jgi:hypothetical protein